MRPWGPVPEVRLGLEKPPDTAFPILLQLPARWQPPVPLTSEAGEKVQHLICQGKGLFAFGLSSLL